MLVENLFPFYGDWMYIKFQQMCTMGGTFAGFDYRLNFAFS